jgi:radical SAM protein with 4Fe4S-binding SPASM domain
MVVMGRRMTARAPRTRPLPLAPVEPGPRRRLPLADESRAVDAMWRPLYAVWEITLRCDLACHHCGSRAGHARPDELTTAEALDVVRQMADLGVNEVTLIGGEAYLRDDWTDIVRAVRTHGMECSITTGGRGLTPERAQAARDAGVQAVSVSIDGLRETHDAMRGLRGSFDAAIAAMRNLNDAGLRVLSNTHINRTNLGELEAIYEVLKAERVRMWLFQITVAMGRAADRPEILLEPYQVLDLMPRLARLKARTDASGPQMIAGNNIGYFGPYDRLLRPHMPDQHCGSCGAGRLSLGLEANGDVKGCPSLPSQDYVGGNLREHSLRDIWERSSALRFTRKRTVEDLYGFCRSCYYAEECLAGCTWTTHALFGKPGNNPFCHHRALELRREGKRERLVRTAAPPGAPFDHGRFEIVQEPWPAEETS